MSVILHILFILSATYILQWLSKFYQPFKFLGAAICCFIIGIAYGNLLHQNEAMLEISEAVISSSVLIGISTMLIGTDFKQWISVSAKTLFAYLLGAISVVTMAFLCVFLFANKMENLGAWSAMLTGAYVGGTPNMSAIQLALGISNDEFAKAFICDAAVSSIYLIVVMTLAKPFLKRFMRSFNTKENIKLDEEGNNSSFSKLSLSKKAISLLLLSSVSLFCIAIVIGLWLLIGKSLAEIEMVYVILGITTCSILVSLIKKVRSIPGSFEMGDFLFCLFFLVLGTKTNVQEIIHISPTLFFFTFCMAFGSFFLHFILSKIFKIDFDTFIITSAAGVMSPPFIPPVAAAIGNKKLLVPGIAVGILGLAIGNFLGILIGKLLM